MNGQSCKHLTEAPADIEAKTPLGCEECLQIKDTWVHLPVATPEGPKPFRKAFPEEAKEIEEMALIAPMVHVYYLGDESYISGEKLQEIARSLSNS